MHHLPSDHQFLMAFDGFGGLSCFFVVLVVWAVAGRVPWGTPYHQILIFVGSFGGFGRRYPLLFP